MNRINFSIIALLLLISCSQSPRYSMAEAAEAPIYDEKASDVQSAEMPSSSSRVTEMSGSVAEGKAEKQGIQSLTSKALLVPDSSDFKLLTTAYIRFETALVAKAIPEIENILLLHKGIIMDSSISASNIYDSSVGESLDSVFYERAENIYGRITVYLFKDQVFDALEEMTPLATQINTRTVSSNDIAVQLLTAKLNMQRAEKKEQRLRNTVDNKPAKLIDALEAEKEIDEAIRQQNSNTIQDFQLSRDLKYVKLSIDVYQKPIVTTYSVAQKKELSMSIADQLILALSFGWNMLSKILLFFIYIWPITLVVIIGFIVFFRYRKRKSSKIE